MVNEFVQLRKYDVAAVFVPSYQSAEKRSNTFWPEGFGEWEIIKNAVTKFPGHDWPRKPAWGWTNDADPYVAQMHIRAALDHGINVFNCIWYWFDNRPYQEQVLNDGLLKAKNADKMKFCLIWANHDATNMYDLRNSHDYDTVIWKGSVNRPDFEYMAQRMIDKFFLLPNYYKIDGKPLLNIYDVCTLVRGLGGVDETRKALEWFRNSAVCAGLPGLHLQMTVWNEGSLKNLSGVDGGRNLPLYEIIRELGFDSTTHYQYVHFTNTARPYPEIMVDVAKEWEAVGSKSGVPYFPNVSLGWDNNPRYKMTTGGIMLESTPANIEKALVLAKEYLDKRPEQHPLIVINAWNEWPESSYLMPDDLNEYGYLKAVKRIFGAR